MAETKQIASTTEVTIEGTLLDIFTYYNEDFAEFLEFFIKEILGYVSDVSFAEGELGYSIQGLPNASFRVNDSGEFIANDLAADPYSIDNNGELIYDDSLAVPVATAASNILATSFTANWNIVTGATKYYLDVSKDSQFNSYVSGYQNLDVGNVLTYEVSRLSGVTYHYRVRACNNIQTGLDSNIISAPTIIYDDWFLSSKDELNEMHVNLNLYGVGNFVSDYYWSSSEYNNVVVWAQTFLDGSAWSSGKNQPYHVRACRSFEAPIGTYSLRDRGPAGGWIFYIDGVGTGYLETAPSDQSEGYMWSNIVDVAIGTTGTAIGTGIANTDLIIAQVGGADDWYLPSLDEADLWHAVLHNYGLGNFYDQAYWTSTEYSIAPTQGMIVNPVIGSQLNNTKTGTFYVRPIRNFTSTVVYSLRDIGPAGGLIYHITDLGGGSYRYLECGLYDLATLQTYSNITTAIGVTAQGTAIGTGQANTTAIINQAGHSDSAAKLCDDYDNFYAHTDSAAKLCKDLVI